VRKRLFAWQGQGFVYLGLEGKAGEPLDQQSEGLFVRAATELAASGLTLGNNMVRTRVFGRTREARNAVSDVRRDIRGQRTRRHFELHCAGAF
jgi:hypothetical protein